MAGRRKWLGAIVGLACGLAAGGAEAAEAAKTAKAPPALNHAVVCPPFKGDTVVAGLYHAEMVRMLKSTPGIEYFEGARPLPEFVFRVNGAVETNEEGQVFVQVTVLDAARKEQIASHVAPASLEPALIAGWSRTIQADMTRRAAKLPFECRISRKLGQESISLDRGLGAGLVPGMVLYVSADEEPLISPATGEIVGRDSPRAIGQVQIFRVMDDAAYARPTLNDKLPRFEKLFARSF